MEYKEVLDKLKKIAPEIYELRKIAQSRNKASSTSKIIKQILSGNLDRFPEEFIKEESNNDAPPEFNKLYFKLPNGKIKYLDKND